MKNQTFFSMLTTFLAMAYVVSAFTLNGHPDMTLWRHVEGTSHENNASHAEFYPCGSAYFAKVSMGETSSESEWSIKNEGTTDLIIDLPLRLVGFADPNRYVITQQPSESIIAPGKEVIFTMQYNKTADLTGMMLMVGSNDSNKNGCGLFMLGGNGTDDRDCYCNRSGIVEEVLKAADGFPSGLLLNTGPCPSGTVGLPCSNISITDPCECRNLITNANGDQLFRDILSITNAGANMNIVLTANNPTMSPDTSFLNIDGTDVTVPTTFGMTDAMGNRMLDTFYRRPLTTVSIRINGSPFVSPDRCPSVDDCIPAVPILSEWGFIVFSIFLACMGVVAIRQRVWM